MSKVRKGKQIAAVVMAVALSAAMVTTGVLPNTTVHVHAEEDGSVYKKIADSSVDGFYYEQNVWGYIQCTTDKTLEYSSYDEMIKKLSAITKKIVQENAYDRYSFSFPIKISSAAKDERFENDQVNKDLENEVYKEETGDPKGGHTMASMGGGLTNIYDITYSESEKAYIGEVTGSGGYGSKKDRYDQTVKKLNEIIKNLNLDGKSDYEKCKSIMWWIRNHVKYDDHYNGEPSKPAGTKYPHDMTGAVLDSYAVCDGYAGVFYYMANAVGIKALYDDGKAYSGGHAWNLVQINGMYYYIDPTASRLHFSSDGELTAEILWGSNNATFKTYVPATDEIKKTYKNISQDDYLKEHSVCKGHHNLRENGGKSALCETPATIRYECTNPGCLYEYEVESSPALGHLWDEGKVTQEQSCDNPEITTYTCTRSGCKKKKQVETKPALGHTWDEGKVTKEATCSATGVKTYTCTRCGGTKTEEIPKTKHNYEEHVETPATCTSRGISYYVCKNCGRTTSRYQTPKKDHTPEIRNKKEATCKAEGYTGDTYCSVCNKKISAGQKIAKLDHTPGEWEIIQPTCKKYGIKRRDCIVCGASLDLEVLEKLDHTWKLTSTTPATCGIGEIQHYKCSVCGETKDVTLDNPLSHTWDSGKVSKKPTCMETGIKTYTCTNCGTTREETIESTGHLHKETKDQKAATCTEDGYTGDIYCSDCGTKLESGTVINKLGHTWDNGVITKEATETEEGVKTYTCKTCGATKTESIPVISHHWDQGTVSKEATCTEDGEKTYHCTDEGCNKTWVETIPATGHQHTELRNEKKATCTEEGYTGDTYCTDCGELIKKGSATEKTDHNWKVTSEEKATCEKDGSKTFTCTECGETKTETTPKTGHKFSNWKTVKAQSIYSGAVQERTCNSCGKKETKIVGDKLKPVLKVNAPKLQLKRGQKTQKFTLTDIAKGDSVKSWVSSNKKIVTVSGKPNGTCIIKAGKKTGSAKITITMRSNLKKTIGVKVQKNAVACTSIKNVPKKLTLKRKRSYQLKPVINPITCTYKAKYKTSNKKIVKVTSKGKITAVKKGKAKITVMVGKKKFVCTVTVR